MMITNLLATKLHAPSLPPKRVSRPQLVQRLTDGLQSGRPITLISAPAGFGKTVCASEWVSGLDLPVCWLSLDAADDDPRRFFAYLIAALQTVDENLGWEVDAVLQSGQLPPSEIISTTLINDILALDFRFLLVLDDFQVIQDRFILQVLECLVLNHPRPLHLVLLTREDPMLPLARLRANNQLTEIRTRDLRFKEPQVIHLMNRVLKLSLSPADIAALEKRTEGWVVGLQLAGFSMQDRANPSHFIATLSGSHRHILNYLTEEVLNQQAPEIQRFLLQTSILDRLTGDLCSAVTGRTDSHSLLERLLAANLFLLPLDDAQQWYRYHQLFADLLRSLLASQPAEEIVKLHQRATSWYAQAGLADEAIQHAIAAADHATAVQLLEEHATDMVMQGYAKTVDGWMESIPHAWRSQSSKTNLALAWTHALRGNYPQALSYLERLETVLQTGQEKNPSIKAEWLALQTLMLNMQGKAVDAMSQAKQALAIAPADDSHSQGLAFYALAGVFQLTEEYAKAMEAYQSAIQHGRNSTNLVTEMMSVSALAVMALERGQLSLAFEFASPAVDRIERSESLPPISAVVYGVLGQVQYQWHQIEPARHHISRAIQLSALGGFKSGAIYYPMLLSRLFQQTGELEAAARELQKAVALVGAQAPADLRQEVAAQQVRLYLAQGRAAAAELALQAHRFSFGDGFAFPQLEAGKITHAVGVLYNSALRLLLYQAQKRQTSQQLHDGLELANRLIDAALDRQYLLVALETLLLRAQMQVALEQQETGQVDCAKALELAEPEGIITGFLEQGPTVMRLLQNLLAEKRLSANAAEHVKRVLQAYGQSSSPAGADLAAAAGSATLIEPLTGREREVLKLMAQGLKYQEIADRLFISLNTVRFYVKEIYSKLNVNNRTKAIALARQHKLI